jgi:tetratricopeptide (TPR) repeat protein
MRAGRLTASVALALVVGGCGRDTEFALRFEAERARWLADRAEAVAPDAHERLREIHARIAERYGPTGTPGARELADRDRDRRFRIAGASALYVADLTATLGEIPAAATAYGRVAEVYAFDTGLAYRALLGEGHMREALGEQARALSLYETLLANYPAVRHGTDAPEGAPTAVNERLLDLEIRTLLLGADVLSRSERSARAAAIRERTRAVVSRSPAGAVRRRLLRHLAETYFAEGAFATGLSELATAAATARGEEAARLALEAGQARLRGGGSLREAESDYRRALEHGVGTWVEAEACLRLGEVLWRLGRPDEGLALCDRLLELRPRQTEGRRAEGLLWKARCLVAVDRWEDALPVFAAVPRAEPGSPWGLVALGEMLARQRSLYTPTAALSTAAEAVRVAAAVPGTSPLANVGAGWVRTVRREREREAWRDGVEVLRSLARRWPDESWAEAARAESTRLARERVGE